ncbi:MAG: 1-acyl-sn-glycerol-3-phosphate acyltransferase [Rhodoferax sp.]
MLFTGRPWAGALLALAGWGVDFKGLPARQGVVIIYPHTSNWDFVVLVLAKWAIGLPASFWGKDTLFKLPVFGSWLRWIGGLPVVRNAPQGVVGQAVRALQLARQQDRVLWWGLSPEGTRSYTPGWRSGFYQVALGARVPLLLVRLDYSRKRVDATTVLEVSGDRVRDIAAIAAAYAGVRGLRAQLASPVQWLRKEVEHEPY